MWCVLFEAPDRCDAGCRWRGGGEDGVGAAAATSCVASDAAAALRPRQLHASEAAAMDARHTPSRHMTMVCAVCHTGRLRP